MVVVGLGFGLIRSFNRGVWVNRFRVWVLGTRWRHPPVGPSGTRPMRGRLASLSRFRVRKERLDRLQTL